MPCEDSFGETNLVPALHELVFRASQEIHQSLVAELLTHFQNADVNGSHLLKQKVTEMLQLRGLVSEPTIDDIAECVTSILASYSEKE